MISCDSTKSFCRAISPHSHVSLFISEAPILIIIGRSLSHVRYSGRNLEWDPSFLFENHDTHDTILYLRNLHPPNKDVSISRQISIINAGFRFLFDYFSICTEVRRAYAKLRTLGAEGGRESLARWMREERAEREISVGYCVYYCPAAVPQNDVLINV